MFAVQCFVLLWRQCNGSEFGDLKLQPRGLFAVGVRVGGLVEPSRQFTPLLMGGADLLRERLSVSEGIQHGELCAAAKQQLVCVLAVNIDELRADLGQVVGRHAAPVDVAAGATISADRAA